METFDEFDQPVLPGKSTGEIISHAFEVYKGVFLYAILALVLYLIISSILQPISGFDSDSFSETIRDSEGDFSGLNMWSMPGLSTLYALSGLLGVLFSPIYVGLIYMANKYDLKESLNISDLFIGYKQNFLNIVIYSLLSSIILGIAFMLCVLPGFFVLPLLFLGYPVLLFENATFSQAFSKSFEIAKQNYGSFLGASFLSVLISISGVILCGVGLLATGLFSVVAMYSTYCAFCGRPRSLLITK